MGTGELIRAARKAKKLTQKQLGELSGIAEPTIRRYELGKLNPKYETLQRIARALDVHILSLIDWDGVPDPPPDVVAPSIEELEEMEREEMRPRLLSYYDELNDEGQQKAVERVAELTEIPRYRAQTTPQSTQASQEGKDTTPPPDAPETPPEGE